MNLKKYNLINLNKHSVYLRNFNMHINMDIKTAINRSAVYLRQLLLITHFYNIIIKN